LSLEDSLSGGADQADAILVVTRDADKDAGAAAARHTPAPHTPMSRRKEKT
jgi:hypothetical protein